MSTKFLTIIFTFLVTVISTQTFAQNTKETEVKIKTSAQCDMCKDRIEEALAFTKGVTYADLDVESKIATVRFKTSKNNKKGILEAIAGAGYDADEILAEEKAYDKLPDCCKKGGMDMHHDKN